MQRQCRADHELGSTSIDLPDQWITLHADRTMLMRLGIKLDGGGPHQSKTMMLAELSTLLASGHGDNPTDEVLRQNILGKASVRAREVALTMLRRLYAIGETTPVGTVLRRLWLLDSEARPRLALLCALARDPAFRASADTVLDAVLGEPVRAPALAAAFERVNPGRLGLKMAGSLSRNAASSWTQAGYLKGVVRKERIRVKATPVAAAYAALLASLCGFGGARLLGSRWLDVLDCPTEERLGLLRQAEGLGLARVRSAGDVLEIEVRRPMADSLGVPKLVAG
jgi:hypothetical protein